jgi:thymidine phosphorylase
MPATPATPATPAFLPQEIIRRKRDGLALTPEEITFFVKGLSDGSITDGQVAALAMAVHFRGMDLEECTVLTQAMTLSGERLTWGDLDLDGPILDKHSTGGVGDKVSLMLAPILAACGGFVPMVSGRGLGHTGGTLDKLDSIPGYDTTPALPLFRSVVKQAGCAIVGQTGQLAPADDRFYALRDVTATVDPISLITASILSKKLAAGLQYLVMDVKVGNGAFSTTLEEAAELAESIATVASGSGLPTGTLITDMGQVLGRTAGNALEVRETVDYLTGTYRNERLHELVCALASELLTMGELAATPEEAAEKVEAALSSGRAAERFERMVAGLGGPASLLSNADQHLQSAPVQQPVYAEEEGHVQRMDTRALGIAVIELGGGRRRPDDTIDHAVGLSEVIGRGEKADADRPLAIVHARTEEDAARAAETIRNAVEIGDEASSPSRIVHMKLGPVTS